MKKTYGKSVSAQNYITVISGLPGTGKSHLLKNKIIPELIGKNKKLIVVDVNKEFVGGPGCMVYRISNYAKAADEVEELAAYMLKHPQIVDVLIIDEANVCLDKSTLGPALKKLINTLRHEKTDLICAVRRPVSLNTDIMELARKRYVFKTSGVNDIKRLNEYVAGLGDAAAALEGHNYLEVINDSKVIEHKT